MNWTAKEELKYSWADRSRCTLGNKYSCWEKGSLRFLWWTTNTFAVLNHQLIFERCFLWVFEIKEKIYIFKESDHNKTRIAVKLLNSAVFEFTAHQICHCNAFCHNLHMRKVEQQQNTSGCRDKTFLTGKGLDMLCRRQIFDSLWCFLSVDDSRQVYWFFWIRSNRYSHNKTVSIFDSHISVQWVSELFIRLISSQVCLKEAVLGLNHSDLFIFDNRSLHTDSGVTELFVRFDWFIEKICVITRNWTDPSRELQDRNCGIKITFSTIIYPIVSWKYK